MPGGHIQPVSLTKRFAEIAADNVDLTVDSGEFFSLPAPSGCGKTTTLRQIAGSGQPASGRILLDGVARWLVDRPDGGGNAVAVRKARIGMRSDQYGDDEDVDRSRSNLWALAWSLRA